jgi:hypothetical protein
MSGSTSPFVDPAEYLPPGLVFQRAYDDGLHAAWAANGYQPLTLAQAIAATAVPPAAPTTIKRCGEDDVSPDIGGQTAP